MPIDNNKKVAILPVRAGSQRVKNKNFRKFSNSTLFEIKLDQLLRLNFIDEVVVSSDSAMALEIAKSRGAKVHKRENFYASSECTNSEFFLNFCEMTDAKHIIYSPCTSPLITDETYRDFVNSFYKMEKEHDSLATVNVLKKHMWDDSGPLNYDLSTSPNSQNLPDTYVITYGINMISRESLIENKNIVGKKPKFFIIDEIEGIDIDNIEEFEIAEMFYNKAL